MPDFTKPPESPVAARRALIANLLTDAERRLAALPLGDARRSRVIRQIVGLTDELDALDRGEVA